MQLEIIDQLAEMKAREKADDKIDEFKDTLDRCMTAQLILSLPDMSWHEINGLIDCFAELVMEDVQKILELKNICKGDQKTMSKIMEKYESEIRTKVNELLEQGMSQKQCIEALTMQFNKLSKSMLTNAYKKIRADWDEAHKEEDPDVEEALEKIADIIGESQEEIKVDKIIEDADRYAQEAEKEQPKVICEGNSCGKTPVKEIKEEKVTEKPKGLKVLSMTVQGENGTYRVCEQGVELISSNMTMFFENELQLNKFLGEFREVFSMVR
jgi:predicted transcriptional regulator